MSMGEVMTSQEVRDVLLKCAAIVRGGWCRHMPAKNAAGKRVGPRERSAVQFCAIGAIQRVCGGPEDGWEARRALREVVCMEISAWNDGIARDAEQVAQAFEEAARTTA